VQRAQIVTVVHVTVVIVRGAMVVDPASRARNRRNRSPARNVVNKANQRRSRNRLKPWRVATSQNANAHAAAEGVVIEATARNAKRNPPAKPSLRSKCQRMMRQPLRVQNKVSVRSEATAHVVAAVAEYARRVRSAQLKPLRRVRWKAQAARRTWKATHR
jgi:hypothetical protein